MKEKDLIKAIYKGLPEENRENPELETYELLTEEQKKEVDELSEGPLEWLEKEELNEYKLNFHANFFSSLFKYRSSELRSPMENYTTESLVFILRLSIESDKIFFSQFLSLIDKNLILKEDDVIHIETQRRFLTKIGKDESTAAIPDITIIINTLYLFIEVKVGSSLNEENVGDLDSQETINQLNKYKSIILKLNNINTIQLCTLTILKEKTEVGFSYSAITWSQIAVLIVNYKTTDKTFKRLISEFSNFIKSKNMAVDKVKIILNEGVLQLSKLLFQIRIGLDKLGNSYKTKLSTGETYSGYYIEKENLFKLWIGFEFKNQTIKIQVVNKELITYLIENNKYIIDPDSKNFILLSDLLKEKSDYFDLSADNQLDTIDNWLVTNINRLELFITETGRDFKLNF